MIAKPSRSNPRPPRAARACRPRARLRRWPAARDRRVARARLGCRRRPPRPTPSGAAAARVWRRAAPPASRSAPSAPTAQPFATAQQRGAAATSVLPLPTSPCSSRFIGTSRVMSSQISAITRPLRAGQRERQRCSKLVEQTGRHAQRAARRDRCSRSARRSCARRRQRQELREDESLARALRLFGLSGRVHRAVGVAQRPVAARLRDRAAAPDRSPREIKQTSRDSSSPRRRSCGLPDPCSRDRPAPARRDTSLVLAQRAYCATLTTGPANVRSTRPRTNRRIPSRNRP